MAQRYIIVSKLNGLALAAEGGNQGPGTRVAPFPRTGDISQQFYTDNATGTIRSAMNNFCLDIEGGDKSLRLMPYQPGDPNQQWEFDDKGCCRNRVRSHHVLDIFHNNKEPGAEVGMYTHHGGHNQTWECDFVGGFGGQFGGQGGYPGGGYQGQGYPGQQQGYPGQQNPQGGGYPGDQGGYGQGGYPGGQGGYPGGQGGYPGGQVGYPGDQGGYPGGQGGYPGGPGGYQAGYGGQGGFQSAGWTRRDFVIVSEMNGKVMDVKDKNPNPGGHLHMWDKHHPPAQNQLWYKDQSGILRSALNDFAITANTGEKAKLEPFNNSQTQQWVHEGNKIFNPAIQQCLDIWGAHTHEGADVGTYQYNGQNNQHWRLEYVNN